MPWNPPPQELRSRVNAALGEDVYGWAERQWLKVLAQDPEMALSSWYRTPEEHARLKGAATYSQHRLGLAVDVTPSQGRYERVAKAAQEAGFWIKRYPGHLHIQALKPDRFAAFLPALRRLGVWNR